MPNVAALAARAAASLAYGSTKPDGRRADQFDVSIFVAEGEAWVAASLFLTDTHVVWMNKDDGNDVYSQQYSCFERVDLEPQPRVYPRVVVLTHKRRRTLCMKVYNAHGAGQKEETYHEALLTVLRLRLDEARAATALLRFHRAQTRLARSTCSIEPKAAKRSRTDRPEATGASKAEDEEEKKPTPCRHPPHKIIASCVFSSAEPSRSSSPNGEPSTPSAHAEGQRPHH